MHSPVTYPVGVQDFEKIRTEGYLYVDKTAFMRQLIDTGCYFFLSRPRRFGKSLLISTFAAYFRGDKELFKGLDIEKSADRSADEAWPKHPVLRLDLGGQEYTDDQALHAVLNKKLNDWETLYGRRDDEIGPAMRFGGVIERAWEKTRRQVVILVDEYDKPLLETADNEARHEKYRATLRAFYFNLKSCDQYIKFAFLTGVTKFSKLSVFSDINNLSDISMQPEYAAICGITQDELKAHFSQGIARLARKYDISPNQAEARLKKLYDGYCFGYDDAHPEDAGRIESVYNPFSLLSAFQKNALADYWFESGTPKFLVEMLKGRHIDIDPEHLAETPVEAASLNALDALTGLPILYQSGYLTISRGDDLGNVYLRFPNEEVERGFLRQLLPLYAARDKAAANALLTRLVGHIRAGRPEDLMRELQALFADIPYEQGTPTEAYFRNILLVVIRLIGFSCEAEHALAGGRLDMVIKTRDFIYVLEVKVNKSAQAALKQITEKGYAEPYAADTRTLFRIGVNFSTKTKRITKWLIREGAA